MQNTELRPLGAGEILDRAVTLFVRSFAPLTVVLAAAIVPVLLFEALVAPGSTRMITDMGAVFTAGGKAQTARALDALTKDQGGAAQYALVIFVSYAIRVMMWSAILAVASSAYAGAAIGLGAAYRIGLRKWFPQVLVALAFLVLGSVASVPLFVAYLLAIAGALMLTAMHAQIAAIVFGVLAGVTILGGMALIASWTFMTYEVASAALVIENVGPIEAVTRGIRRTGSRQTFWRTVVGGLILFFVTQGAVLLFTTAGIVLAAITRVPSLSFAILGGGQIVVDGLLAVFVVVFVTDVRVRREGLDLAAIAAAPE